MIDKKIPYWINTKFISDKRGSLYKFINHSYKRNKIQINRGTNFRI